MSEHLSQSHIDRYRERQLSPTELLSVDDHIAACADCRGVLERAAAGSESAGPDVADRSRIPDIGHLTYDQFAAYVDRTLAQEERETLDRHLSECRSCAAELEDLTGFRATLSTYPDRVY